MDTVLTVQFFLGFMLGAVVAVLLLVLVNALERARDYHKVRFNPQPPEDVTEFGLRD